MIRTFGWAVLLSVALPAAAAQQENGGSRPATALESMLAGHVCGEPKSLDPKDQDARERCVTEQLLALRADFGYDLSRLSAAERQRLNATCSRLRTNYSYDVERYLACLTHGLVSLRAQSTPATPGQPSFGPQTAVLPASPQTAPKRGWLLGFIALLTGVTLAAGAVAAVATRKSWLRVERHCRQCGAAMQSAGELCPACRHRAAVALKQAVADRAEQERAEQEARRRQQEEAEARQRLREEQEAQLRGEEEARLAELEQARGCAAQAPPPIDTTSHQPADDTPPPFDPYAVLNVSPDATPEEIDAAYRQARSKYDQELVAHLGDEVRMHFKLKAQSIEQAYEHLCNSAQSAPETARASFGR